MSKQWKSDNHTRIPHNISMQGTKCYYCPHCMNMASSEQYTSATRFHIYPEIANYSLNPQCKHTLLMK
jgi:hypothetical protein